MAKTKQLMVRVSPFDLDLDLYQRADALRVQMKKTWRAFLSEGVQLVIAREAMEVTSNTGGIEEV